MTNKANSKNWDRLITSIEQYIISEPHVSKSLIVGIDNLCKKLQDGKLSLANRDINGGKIIVESLINFFCRTFDPILGNLIAINSTTHTALKFQELEILPSDNLPKVQLCEKIACRIEEAISWLQSLTESELTETVAQNCKDLGLIAYILHAIEVELKIDKIRWCDACFRRTHKKPKTIKQSQLDDSRPKQTFTYCKEHSYLDIKDNEYRGQLKDTVTAKAIFNRENFKPIFQTKCPQTKRELFYINSKRYRDDRLLLGETFECSTEEQCNAGLSEKQIIVNIIESTITKPWADISCAWDEVLKNLTKVKIKVINDASTHNSWESFRLDVLKKLENQSEKTKNPYWFYRMLLDANEWLSLDEAPKYKKTKKTEVLALMIENKNLSDTQIIGIFKAANSCISKGYVSKIRDEYTKTM